MELFTGRPADCAGRLAREVRVYDYLDRLGIEYWRTDHFDMPAMTMADCERIDGVLAERLQIEGLDLDKNAVQRIESGERFVTDIELKVLSRVLGVSADELLNAKDIQNIS